MTGKVSKYIPVDVSLSILSKLSPKPLRRFQCVCKSWSMLFQNLYFMRIYGNHIIHRNHSDYDDASVMLVHTSLVKPEPVPVPVRGSLDQLWITNLYLISGNRFEKRVELNLSLPLEVLGTDIFISGSISINGILCLTNIIGPCKKVVLCNPITHEFHVIPPSPIEEELVFPRTMVLPRIHGIGYDRLRDDYKVIRHLQFNNRSFYRSFDRKLSMEERLSIYKEPLWEIYSLRSNSWKKLDVDDMSMVMFPKWKSHIARFYMDGMCHWWDNVEKDSSDETYFVSFDVSNELFFTTPMPDVDDTFDLKLVKRQLVMLNGSIALISYSW
ncbi:hypothetical protein TSUD_384450 [Trifolium subterraneum]|uniref:F-box domain-containing protein n=1 Tax=Trifolium subterraneum TaxID=3900 RepID=A0A2Z6NGG1_TRISU|nr:hypothetical protein TSUD_384450 [Trifolium subterraneum]